MLDSDGSVLTGFRTYNNKVYYFEEKSENYGAMVYGEKDINGIIYEFDQSGALVTNSNKPTKVVAGIWTYYPNINKWGFMAGEDGITLTQLVNGRYLIKGADNNFTEYVFDANGHLVE